MIERQINPKEKQNPAQPRLVHIIASCFLLVLKAFTGLTGFQSCPPFAEGTLGLWSEKQNQQLYSTQA